MSRDYHAAFLRWENYNFKTAVFIWALSLYYYRELWSIALLYYIGHHEHPSTQNFCHELLSPHSTLFHKDLKLNHLYTTSLYPFTSTYTKPRLLGRLIHVRSSCSYLRHWICVAQAGIHSITISLISLATRLDHEEVVYLRKRGMYTNVCYIIPHWIMPQMFNAVAFIVYSPNRVVAS